MQILLLALYDHYQSNCHLFSMDISHWAMLHKGIISNTFQYCRFINTWFCDQITLEIPYQYSCPFASKSCQLLRFLQGTEVCVPNCQFTSCWSVSIHNLLCCCANSCCANSCYENSCCANLCCANLRYFITQTQCKFILCFSSMAINRNDLLDNLLANS